MIEVLALLQLITITILGTTTYHVAKRLKAEAEAILLESRKCRDEATALISTVNSAHTSLVDQVLLLTKKQDDLKNTLTAIQLRK